MIVFGAQIFRCLPGAGAEHAVPIRHRSAAGDLLGLQRGLHGCAARPPSPSPHCGPSSVLIFRTVRQCFFRHPGPIPEVQFGMGWYNFLEIVSVGLQFGVLISSQPPHFNIQAFQ